MLNVLYDYFGKTIYLILLILLLLCLWIKRETILAKKILVAVTVFGLLVPVLHVICERFGVKNVSYRMFWLIPLSVVIPIGCVWVLQRVGNTGRIYGMISIFAVLFGSFYWLGNGIKMPDNIYKLDADVIELAEIIEDDAETEYIKVVGEVAFMRQIRQYSARFIWGYDNRGCMMDTHTRNMKDIYIRVASAVQDEFYSKSVDIYTDLEQLEIDYVVLYQEKQFVDHLPQGSYEIIGETDNYKVIKMHYDYLQLEGFEIDEKEIIIPGMLGEYHFAIVNDMHIIQINEEVSKESRELVEQRGLSFSANGKTSTDNWDILYPQLDELGADLLIFNGDMIDYFSTANFETLEHGLVSLKTPYVYLRADHDLGPWWTEIEDSMYINDLERTLDDNKEIYELDYDEFIVLGINNNTSQLSVNALKEVERVFEKDKPVIIVAHVPYASKVSDDLLNASMQAWDNRGLFWGEEGIYQPNENTQKFLDLIYASDSPVVAVIGAHLHFPYTGMINDNITEYVFDASYKGKVGYVTVRGE